MMGILMDLTLRSNGAGTKDKTLIMDGDKVFYTRPTDELSAALMPNGVMDISKSDNRVTIAGTTYKVVTIKWVDPMATMAVPVMFELYLRR